MTVDEYVKEYEVDAEFLPKNEVLYQEHLNPSIMEFMESVGQS